MKKILAITSLIVSVAGLYAADWAYTYNTTQELNKLLGNTLITGDGTVITMTSQNETNWNLQIDAGATLKATNTLQFGKNTTQNITNSIDVYGTIDMNGKQLRFADDSLNGWNSTLNLYSGSTLTSTAGAFELCNFNGAYTEYNVYKGASISNMGSFNAFNRGYEKSATPTLLMNVEGSVTQSGNTNLGNASRTDGTIQKSTVNIKNGGSWTATNSSLNVGTNAGNDAYFNLSGVGSKASFKDAVIGKGIETATGKISIATGSNLTVSSKVTVSATGTLDFVIDNNLISETSLLNVKNFTVNDGGVITISMSQQLGKIEGWEAEKAFNVALFDFDSSASSLSMGTFNNQLRTITSDEQLQTIFASAGLTVNFAGNEYWKVASIEDLHLDAENSLVYITLTTTVPEPSTYAAIFGVLALGFVIYRRRK